MNVHYRAGSEFFYYFALLMRTKVCDFRIIPQAVSVRYGLAVGATCAPLVLAMMYIFGSQKYFSFFFRCL